MRAPTVTVVSPKAPPIREEEILRYAGGSRDDAATVSLMRDCIGELQGELSYRVCFSELPLLLRGETADLGFARVSSRALCRCLSGCTGVILMAATVGLAPDRRIARCQRIAPSRALMLSAFGSERVESLCDAWEAELRQARSALGQGVRPRFSPGYGDLPLTFQREVFAALPCTKYLGITLNERLLMTPSKSVTALVGLYPHS